jgi:hypothetical protein
VAHAGDSFVLMLGGGELEARLPQLRGPLW